MPVQKISPFGLEDEGRAPTRAGGSANSPPHCSRQANARSTSRATRRDALGKLPPPSVSGCAPAHHTAGSPPRSTWAAPPPYASMCRAKLTCSALTLWLVPAWPLSISKVLQMRKGMGLRSERGGTRRLERTARQQTGTGRVHDFRESPPGLDEGRHGPHGGIDVGAGAPFPKSSNSGRPDYSVRDRFGHQLEGALPRRLARWGCCWPCVRENHRRTDFIRPPAPRLCVDWPNLRVAWCKQDEKLAITARAWRSTFESDGRRLRA